MAKTKTDAPKPTEAPKDAPLTTAAKAIGTAAGNVAAKLGATATPPKVKIPKLAKKNKKRLPRKDKKLAKKKAAAAK